MRPQRCEHHDVTWEKCGSKTLINGQPCPTVPFQAAPNTSTPPGQHMFKRERLQNAQLVRCIKHHVLGSMHLHKV